MQHIRGFARGALVDQNASGQGICSGSLIAPTKVLTAAHCVDDGVSEITARYRNGQGGLAEVGASSWASHPGYSFSSSLGGQNDVAIVSLSGVIPVRPLSVMISRAPQIGQTVTLMGWGDSSGDSGAGLLRAGQTVIESYTSQQILLPAAL